jgi:hypothetical protein
VLIFCVLGIFITGCATMVFFTTRSSLRGSASADAIALFEAITVLVFSGMFIYLLASDYRPHRRLQLAVAVVFCSGLPVSFYLAGRTLHLPPAAAATSALLSTVAAFRFTRRKVGRDSGRVLAFLLKPLRDGTDANQMAVAIQKMLRARRHRLDSEEYGTARINEARALVARSTTDGFPDGLVAAVDGLREVLDDPPEDWLLLFKAAEELADAMDLKATKHGDLAGYPEALDMLRSAARRAPPDAGAMASVHHLTAEYQMTLAGRTSGPQAEAQVDAAIAELRQSIAAVTRVGRVMLPGLYAKLGRYMANRRKEPQDLDEGIALCRQGQRLARFSPRARVLPDLMLASLLLDRAWETVQSVDDSTPDAAVAAAGSSIRRDLRDTTALVRRAQRHGSSEQRIEALELHAQVQAAREETFDESYRRPAVAAAWRAAAQASTRGSVPVMVRLVRAWIGWAEGTGEARWCAEAYQHLMSLVPRAVAVRYLTTERDRLLAGVQHSAEEAGYWLASLGRLRDAAVALELGRAVSISEEVGRERPEVPEILARAGLPSYGTGTRRRLPPWVRDRTGRTHPAGLAAQRSGPGRSTTPCCARWL